MDPRRFDNLMRGLPFGSRRAVLVAVAGLLASSLRDDTEARKRRKRKKRNLPPLQLNAFGCVEVGDSCRGSGANCCSGRCAGDKPKPGKPDQSRCVAHDADTCVAGQTLIDCGGTADVACTTAQGAPGQCVTTIGKAPYCFAGGGVCFRCAKDADCIRFCGVRAACVQCAGDCPQTGGLTCVGQEFCNNP
jgi:hypothetical protein